MRKIVFLINSMNAGGAERVVSLLLPGLQKDFDVHLVLLSNTIEYELPAGITIHSLDQPENEPGSLKILKLPLLALRYKKYCRKNNIEVSFSLLKRANFINCLAKTFGLKCRIIISERTYLSKYLSFIGKAGKISSSLTKKLYPKADLVITNSALIKKDLEENFNIHTQYKVIHNPVNIAFIENAMKEEVDAGLFEGFTFISVGGFRKEKNYELLIEAFAKLNEAGSRLLLVGKGDQEMMLKKKVADLGLESRIIFPGFDTNPYKYLSRASCFVLSSDFEGFPNSLQEALACRIPVIATDCLSGPREILAPGTCDQPPISTGVELSDYGILVPVKNAEMMAKAMKMVYSDPVLAGNLSKNGLIRAMDFDLPGITLQFKEAILS